MSTKELDRAGVLARVGSKQLRVVDAAVVMRLSYRQAKRLWKRYRERGAAGLKHGNAERRRRTNDKATQRGERRSGGAIPPVFCKCRF